MIINFEIEEKEQTTITVFEAKCNKCKKRINIHARDGYIGNKHVDYIVCSCGNHISVWLMKRLWKNKEYINKRLQYFIT